MEFKQHRLFQSPFYFCKYYSGHAAHNTCDHLASLPILIYCYESYVSEWFIALNDPFKRFLLIGFGDISQSQQPMGERLSPSSALPVKGG
jgi:hypothetical protein